MSAARNPADHPLLLIAGSGRYPALLIDQARKAGVPRIFAAVFENETSPEISELADEIRVLRVGQLGKLMDFAKKSHAPHAMMAGQITPGSLYEMRPDVKALFLLARLKERNAETLFGSLSDQLGKVGVEVLPATTFLESHLAPDGRIAGPMPTRRTLEDLAFGFGLARETSRLNIGQSVVVRNGTVLAVEAFEGTDACIRRGGELGKGRAALVKVTKPDQDMRFDVPVVGERTLETARKSGIMAIGVEAGRTLLLDRPEVCRLADNFRISLFGLQTQN